MRRQIQRLARGKFEYSGPSPVFSTDKIDIEALEGKEFNGDFVITSANHVPMRGIIYSSNPRMECLTPQFEGEEVRIRYRFHSGGLTEGDIQKGGFCVVVEQGEYNLSFVVSISRLYADSSIGKIRTLDDFCTLARESFDEAYRLFYSQNFKNILKAEEKREQLLYEAFSQGQPSGQKVEEFLVSCHKKPRAEVRLSAAEAECYGVSGTRKETLELRKSCWGYLDIRIASDADFLKTEKRRLGGEDFLGSTCSLGYYIEEGKLHGGKNYGRLFFEMPGETLVFSVCASRGKHRDGTETAAYREIKECRAGLLKRYVDYRLKRTVTGVWAKESGEMLDRLLTLLPEEKLYLLMKAHAWIINRQKQEADWMMEDFKRSWTDKNAPEWGYYLYLCTLMEKEPSYVRRIGEEIEQIFRRNPESSLLFWIRLFVREEDGCYPKKRLKAIEMWTERVQSPYFYLEAYELIRQDPYLLAKLGDFEIRMLYWAAREGAITEEMASQIVERLPDRKGFSMLLYRILEQCYEVRPREETLSAICGYLIKSQRFQPEYHKWYDLGIAREIRVIGLYEAYLASLDGRTVGNVPRMLQMYFQYGNHLPYQQKAVLFVNIIAAKETQPEVYRKYRPSMEAFALEQIAEGHINDNLAVIYEEALKGGVFKEEVPEQLPFLLFTHKFTCFTDKAAKLSVYQRQLKRPQATAIAGRTAYFPAYTDDYCLVIEDIHGNCFCESIDDTDEPLFHPEPCLEKCAAAAGTALPYLLYRVRGKESCGEFSAEDVRCLVSLLRSDAVSEAYKAEIQPELVRYDAEQGRGSLLGKYLLELDYGICTVQARRFILETLVREHLYEKAYAMVQSDGYDYLTDQAKRDLCSYGIAAAGFEEDDFLSGFAETVFLRGTYNDVLLIYLCKYYNGPAKVMAELWRAAEAFEIDTFDLEERIITQMLYTTEYVANVDKIYDSYAARGGKETVCLAYLSYFAHGYLVKDAVVPDQVFAHISKRMERQMELNDACRLGLLKHLAGKEARSREETETADQLLGIYTGRQIYFAFYRRFEKKLMIKHHIYDKFFAEYHGSPKQRIVIHYSMDGIRYRQEEMPEVYDGIFVRPFLLFSGEELQYYVAEQDGQGEQVTESGTVNGGELAESAGEGRYAKLNEMLCHASSGETELLKREMKAYDKMKRVTEEAFGLLL